MHVSNACMCMYVCVATAGVVSTVAGSTVSGYGNGVGTEVKFNNPTGISVDSTGNVWVADRDNHLIKQINTAGRVHPYMHTHIYSACGMCVQLCECVWWSK